MQYLMQLSFNTQIMVEMRGVEPLSESIVMQLSPSASVILDFAASSPNGGLIGHYLDRFPTSLSEN